MNRKRRVEILVVGLLVTVFALIEGGFLYLRWVNARLLGAASSGDSQAVASLLARGANPRAKSPNGEPMLLLAARSNNAFYYPHPNSISPWEPSKSASRGSIETVRLLLDHGADPNVRSPDGDTVLSWMATNDGPRSNRSWLAMALLKHGADPDAHRRDNFGRTSLLYAAERGDLELVRVLVRYGADVNARDVIGQTPLMTAQRLRANQIMALAAFRTMARREPPEQQPPIKRRLDGLRAEFQDTEAIMQLLIQAGATR
jgi:ankyrin repeat protein